MSVLTCGWFRNYQRGGAEPGSQGDGSPQQCLGAHPRWGVGAKLPEADDILVK